MDPGIVNLKSVLILGFVVIAVYNWCLETVPYSKRSHFVILSSTQEINLGEIAIEQVKEHYYGKILPYHHPLNIRVQEVSHNVIEALKKGLKTGQAWIDFNSSPPNEKLCTEEDERISQSRKKGKFKQRGVKSVNEHLEGLKWDVIVVDDPMINAWCSLGGKIGITSDFVMLLGSDAAVAAVIAHEVAHAAARHVAESLSKHICRTTFQLLLHKMLLPGDFSNRMTTDPVLFQKVQLSPRLELEADYIGLLLAASAGYDPRAVSHVFEILRQFEVDSAKRDYHPPIETRMRLLFQENVMEEALSLYGQEHFSPNSSLGICLFLDQLGGWS